MGLSLRSVGGAIGVAHETIRQWEQGRTPRKHLIAEYRLWLAFYGGVVE